MEKPAASAEIIFAQALKFPPGAARDSFVAAQCAAGAILRLEVQSLLEAHDAAGDFLLPPVRPAVSSHPRLSAVP